MLKQITLLSNQITASADSNKTSQTNTLDVYRKLSAIDVQSIRKTIFFETNLELFEKGSTILRDKHAFEQETYQEESREDKIKRVNKQLFRYMTDFKKIMPISDVFNNTPNFLGFIGPLYLFNEALSTKVVVNNQLYYKTISNLGTK
jgi:acyl-CoA oxidase